ncbi:MAG: ATP-binding protein, partial [Candidatus Polarisedimenticolia bacterium]
PGAWSRFRPPAGARAALGLALITAVYVPFLQHAYDRLIRNYFEHDLLPRVLHQAERRRQILRDSLQHAGEPEFAAAARFAEENEDDPADHADEIAYGLWSTTSMAHRGLASSLQVFDARGVRLGRFSLNYAPALDVRFERAAGAAGADLITLPPPARAVVRTPIVYGSRWIQVARQTPLLVTMAVVDDWDNLPLLGSESVYLEMFRSPAPSRTNPELVRGEPMVAAFGPQLERIDGSGEAIPAPPPAALATVGAGRLVWSDGDVGGQPARILYARGARALFALAHPRSSRAGQVASFLRLLLFNAALALAVLAAARLVRAAGGSPLAWPRSTYAGRLVAVLLITGLGPLLALSFFVTRFAQRDFARDLLEAGLTSLDTARRVVEDYLDVSGPDPEPALDDDVVFWLSRVVRQDINVYRGAELLATSTRALYSSGLLNRRLAGGAYRALYLEREPYRLAESRVGGAGWLTLSASMRIDRDGTPGVISIPLAAQRRAVKRRADEVGDTILIVTFAASVLLAATGHVMARRVALPVQHLARAARRVAEGDLDVRVDARGDGETGVLVDTFNRMAASLRAQREDLRRRRDYIEKILRSATTGVVSIDATGGIATINPAAQALLRTGPTAPAPGDRLLVHLASDPAFEPLHRALRRALERSGDREATVVIARPGEERRLRAVFLPFAAEEGAGEPGRIVLLEDVTEVVRAGRLAAFAEMARRVAHEIKNPLTPIQLSVEHVRRLRRAGDPRFGEVLDECLSNIQKQVEVLRQIAHEFSAYARLPRVRPEPTPVADLLDDALKPYETAAPPGVRLARAVAPGLPPLLIDRAVAARALVNLIENALQAMPGGGSITVAAEEDGGGDPVRVRIEVRDTGTGIDPEILPRLFEPYFSTRSGGTGLGLAVARKAVEEQGGTLELKSRPGAGTVAILILPAAPAAVPGGAA